MKLHFKNDTLLVIDPCYEDPNLGITLNGCSGDWNVEVNKLEKRCSSIRIHREESTNPFELVGNIMVDSGQAGIYSRSSWQNEEVVKGVQHITAHNIRPENPWYSLNCDRTLSDKRWGSIPEGVVAASGHGDGEYPVLVKRNSENAIVEITIQFFSGIDDDIMSLEDILEEE